MSNYIPAAGILSDIGSGIKTGASTALNIFGEAQKQAGIAQGMQAGVQAPIPQPGLPGWVLPVALGGGAVLLVLLLKGKKRENPGRRRRRRR